MKRLLTILTIGLILLTTQYIAKAQTISGGISTSIANAGKKGDVAFAYRIGNMGSGTVKVSNNQETSQSNVNTMEELTPSLVTIEAYPNPFTESIRVIFPTKIDAKLPTIQLIDNTGRIYEPRYQYSTSDNNKGNALIDASSIISGRYIIRIITGGCVFAVNAIKI